jgi:hypothetical protein
MPIIRDGLPRSGRYQNSESPLPRNGLERTSAETRKLGTGYQGSWGTACVTADGLRNVEGLRLGYSENRGISEIVYLPRSHSELKPNAFRPDAGTLFALRPKNRRKRPPLRSAPFMRTKEIPRMFARRSLAHAHRE